MRVLFVHREQGTSRLPSSPPLLIPSPSDSLAQSALLFWCASASRLLLLSPARDVLPVDQLLGLPASGEKIIFPLLDPMLHAYRPVMDTLRGGGGGGGGGRAGGEQGEEPVNQAAAPVSDVDKGTGEGEGLDQGQGKGISCPVSFIYGAPDHDWMPHRCAVCACFLRCCHSLSVYLPVAASVALVTLELTVFPETRCPPRCCTRGRCLEAVCVRTCVRLPVFFSP